MKSRLEDEKAKKKKIKNVSNFILLNFIFIFVEIFDGKNSIRLMPCDELEEQRFVFAKNGKKIKQTLSFLI